VWLLETFQANAVGLMNLPQAVRRLLTVIAMAIAIAPASTKAWLQNIQRHFLGAQSSPDLRSFYVTIS